MEALPVVKHLHSLAEKPENRESIVKDQGCLPGLILFLDNQENEVVLLVLQTIQLLAENAANRKIMQKEVGMMESIKKIMQDDRFKAHPAIKRRATALYNKLNVSLMRPSSTQKRIHTVAPTSQKFFVGSSNKKAKLIVLQVNGLHDETSKKLCGDYLLTVRGVVSFTFNMQKNRCMVRVIPKITGEELCKAVERSKLLTAEQVVKNKSGEEVTLSFGSQPNVPGDEKAKLDEDDFPGYLPEEDPVETSKTALARTDDKESGGSGWFGGVSSFISNTLYW